MLSRHACVTFPIHRMPRPQHITRSIPGHSSPCSVPTHRGIHHLVFTSSSAPQELLTNLSTHKPPNFSGLGLRSKLPPDSQPHSEDKSPKDISDHEWHIRTGRAIDLLQNTLPDFFNLGLVTSIDYATGSPRTSHVPAANENGNLLDYHTFNSDIESIYSSKVRLEYTPPVPLPTPFPKTLHVEGLPLYMASSLFVRHTMNALYSDLKVAVNKAVVNSPKPPTQTGSPELDEHHTWNQSKSNREKSLVIRLSVTGKARVSGSPGKWEVEFTYSFSPSTGLIHQHIINSIHPAPHQAVYDSLRLSLGKVFGLSWELGRGPKGAGVACKADGACTGPIEVDRSGKRGI